MNLLCLPTITRRSCLQVAVLAGLFPAVGRSASGSTPERTRVAVSISLEPNALDPTLFPAASIAQVIHLNVLEGLVKIDESGRIQPLLARRWDIAEDRKSYTFTLHPDITFHDGSQLNADTVRFSFERAQQAGSKNKGHDTLFKNVAKIQVHSSQQLTLHLHHPDPLTLFRLGEATAVILHPHSAADAAQHPVGTGPYAFVEWRKGHSVHLQRFEGYRQPDSRRIQQAVFRFIPSLDEQSQALERGEVDASFNLITHDLHRFQADPRYQVMMGATSGKGMLAINHRHPILQDLRVRQALTHAIDKQAFIERVMKGKGTIIGSHFAPTDPGFLNLSNTYPYNPNRARQLLQDAGIQTPLELRLSCLDIPYAREGAPVIAEYLAQVGITLKIEPVTWAQWLGKTFQGDFELTLITHVESLDHLIYADPNYYFGYNSPDFRSLAQRYSSHAASARQRQQLFADMQRHLARDAANIWLFSPQLCTVARRGLQGLQMNYPLLSHDLSGLHWT